MLRIAFTSTSSLRHRTTCLMPRRMDYRFLSSDSNNNNNKQKENARKEEGDDDTELALTPGQQVMAVSRLGMWACIAVFATGCAYYIGKELLPTKMSANQIFDKAFSKVKEHPEVNRRFGDSLKAYGRDHGGHREGRRNFVEHTEYNDEQDGTKRCRVRFNLEGPNGTAFVFAEQSSDMPAGELVYVLVQDKQNGRVITVMDNRAAMTATRLAGGNVQGASVMQDLLTGGRK